METIESQIKENTIFRIIESAIKGDEEKTFVYANKLRKVCVGYPMFDEDTFRKIIHGYFHPEDAHPATMDEIREKRIEGYIKKHERVDGFGKLKDGWDGRGAIRISTNAIEHAHEIINLFALLERDISKWGFFPGVCGEVCIDYKGENAKSTFMIYDCEFSYFVEDDGEQLKGTSNAEFNADRVVNLMKYVEDVNKMSKS